jgi:UDP-N-acetylmuramate dehydrogenase
MNLKENISLKPYNTFGIESKAAFFCAFRSVEEISETLEIAKKHLPVTGTFVLGGGSNILLTQNISGLVLKNEIDGIEKLYESEDAVLIKAGGGVNWHRFVMYCLENNYAGVENLALIPGSVGASPMQNIGAYGVELKDVFHSLEAYHVKEGYTKSFNKEDCRFGYRESIFKNQVKKEFIITSVNFLLSKKPVFKTSYGAIEKELELMGTITLSIHAIAQAVINIRRSKLPDPDVIGNAGSFKSNSTRY